ncbi:serine/threonine protein kinase TAO2 [Encephalitozoon intestinalis]
MTESLDGYREITEIRRDRRIVISSAVDVVTGEKVILEEADLSGISSYYQPLLMGFLLEHELNNSPYVMKVMRVFESSNRIYVVQRHMSLGPVDTTIGNQIFVSDDFVFYVFMQVVYAMKLNGEEGWFWDRMSPRYIWIDEDGKVRICWADVVLGNMKAMVKQLDKWNGRMKSEEKTTGGDKVNSGCEGSVSFGNLRRIFVSLALGVSEVSKVMYSWNGRIGRSGFLGHIQGLSPDLDGLASLLFEDGVGIKDLEEYTRRMIQEKRIASNPREIFKSLGTVLEEMKRDENKTLEETRAWNGKSPRTEEPESGSGSEESGRNMSESGSRGDDERVGSFGTREYRKGRFYVCDAIPLGEREKGLGMNDQMKRMGRIVNVQNRQISLLTGVMRKSGLLDKETDAELGELEDLVNFLLFGVERQ